MAPPPKPIKVEIVKERHPQGPKIEMVEVIPAADFDRYKKSVEGRVALAESVLAGDMVPGEEYRAANQKLTTARKELEATQKTMEMSRQEIETTRKEVGFLRRLVFWIREHFPSIWDHIPMDDLVKENEATHSHPGGPPLGL